LEGGEMAAKSSDRTGISVPVVSVLSSPLKDDKMATTSSIITNMTIAVTSTRSFALEGGWRDAHLVQLRSNTLNIPVTSVLSQPLEAWEMPILGCSSAESFTEIRTASALRKNEIPVMKFSIKRVENYVCTIQL